MKHLKSYNESVQDEEDEKGDRIEVHLTVPVFSGTPLNRKWTTFFSCRRSKTNDRGQYETVGGYDELELRYFDIVWEKYEGKEMPNRDMKGGRFSGLLGYKGPCRPEFEVYPKELIDALSYFENSSFVTEFEKGLKKRYFSKSSGEIDPFPDKEEISKMSLEFQSEEDAFDWLNDLEYLIITNKIDS